MPVGHRILLRQAGTERDERGVHGALPVLVRLRGCATGGAHEPGAAYLGRNAAVAALRIFWHSGAVPAAVSRAGAYHREPRFADGWIDAGAAGGRGCAVCRRAFGSDWLAGTGGLNGWSRADCFG